MSTSLLKKGLKLFEKEEKHDKSTKKTPQRNVKGAIGKSVKKQATVKDRKVKSAIDQFVKKHPKQDRTLENLALLDKLSQKKSVTQESANKVRISMICYLANIFKILIDFFQIFSYQLKKQRKTIEKKQKAKEQSTVFTEEDFLKFEQEYFVKG